ncbi:MAG: redoxin family protein, partial [Alphaproteobacteria bacterium]
CVSVNDAWVMSAWGAAQGVGSNIRMLADGNGAFTEATGLELDASGFGLGQRSTRFSMIVDDGVVTALHVEDDPGEMASTSAEELLKDA